MAEPFEEGIRTDLPHEAYLSIPALSSSALKVIHEQSLMHYDYRRRNPKPPTPNMILGTALHMRVLEPDRAKVEILTVPGDAPKKATKAQINAKSPSAAVIESMDWWAAWERQAEGKVVLDASQAEIVDGMVEAVTNHPRFDELFGGGQAEVSLQWADAGHDMPCKCRFDYLTPDGFGSDLKSCADASPDGFARASAGFLYHFQAAHYATGYEALQGEPLRGFVFVAVESEPPHGVGIYVMPENAIRFALDRIATLKARLKEAQATNRYPGYSTNVQRLVIPKWATQLAIPT